MASAATNAAIMASMASSQHAFIGGALVGSALSDPAGESTLAGLVVEGETIVLGSSGANGGVLFTDCRVLVAERVGVLSKRMAVKSFRRDTILAYSIEADQTVSLTLFGAVGTVALVFDEGFDPMLLSRWLGETLAPAAITRS